MTNSCRALARFALALSLGLSLAFAAPKLALAQTSPVPADAAPDPRLFWDLTRLFPTDAAWDAERQAFVANIAPLAALKGTLGRDAVSLRAGLDLMSAANLKLQRLWVYASTQTSTNSGERRNQERSALMGALWGQYSSAIAFTDPEIQAIGADKIETFIAAEPGLKRHERRLRDVIRLAKHTLTPQTEAALAAMSPVLGAGANTRSLLVDNDVKWPSMQVAGKSVVVSDTGYEALRLHPDRSVRKEAFDLFYKTYGQFENTLGALLVQRVQSGVIDARLRQYPSAVAASLASNAIPEEVVRTLVAQTNQALPTLHRYFKLRGKLLGLGEQHYYDIYPDMVTSTQRYPLEVSSAITLAAMKPLGDDYSSLLQLALNSRSMHVRPEPGKRSGAYATGVYGLTPYIFLNHQDTYESLTTFAHEWGHGLHNMLAQRSQPYETAGYSLFIAEIASITNEVLLSDHMLKQAKTKEERIFVLGHVLERLRASYFRQTMFAEFELATHDAQQRGEGLSGKKFTQIYCQLLRKYHGADAGVMTIDPLYCHEWAYIPHFHRPFYVFVYATSTVAAYHFGEQILAGKPGARENYLDVLRAGGAMHPHELLRRAGLDLATSAPYEALIRRMNAVMDELEKLLVS